MRRTSMLLVISKITFQYLGEINAKTAVLFSRTCESGDKIKAAAQNLWVYPTCEETRTKSGSQGPRLLSFESGLHNMHDVISYRVEYEITYRVQL